LLELTSPSIFIPKSLSRFCKGSHRTSQGNVPNSSVKPTDAAAHKRLYCAQDNGKTNSVLCCRWQRHRNSLRGLLPPDFALYAAVRVGACVCVYTLCVEERVWGMIQNCERIVSSPVPSSERVLGMIRYCECIVSFSPPTPVYLLTLHCRTPKFYFVIYIVCGFAVEMLRVLA